VRQWKSRPYKLNGNPVQMETEVTVNLALEPKRILAHRKSRWAAVRLLAEPELIRNHEIRPH
jgi:hypothetical protein